LLPPAAILCAAVGGAVVVGKGSMLN
jgi:hypothetical protein